ncbi:MAG: hypothetical protein ABI910_06455 [Gemmatimonadota bacterium]
MSRRRGLVALAIVVLPSALSGQSVRTLELSVLGGSVHTDRVARLQAEEWVEPFAGVRLDARLFARWGGRGGFVMQFDQYRLGRNLRFYASCIDICVDRPTVYDPPPNSDYRARASDSRFSVGATWQQPLATWLRAELLAFAGKRRAVNETRLNDVVQGEAPVRRGVVGGELGMRSAWRALIAGVGVQYATGSQWQGVRLGQNRVVLRAGYALRLGGN